MGNALEKFVNTIPSIYKPDSNPVINALLTAIATSDDDVQNSIFLAKDQLFVRTATGNNLNILGKSLGVQRPPTLGLQDNEYQNLIPNLSLKPRQIRKAFYDTADVFWGPLFSRANVNSLNSAPYDLNIGDTFILAVDNKAPQTITVLTGDVQILGSATIEEAQTILSRFVGVTVDIETDLQTGNQTLNIRTNTPGPVGAIDILGGNGFSNSKINFLSGHYNILSLDQRVAVYEISPNEITIEIPAVVPALKRTLRGSHHFHQDATLASPVPPANGIWQGSFFYNPTGSEETVTITSQKCSLQQIVLKNSVNVGIAVDDNSNFKNSSGEIFIGYGTSAQEGPIRYRGLPNKNTILIDPGYSFLFDHQIGTTINVVSQDKPYVPRVDGQDLAIYLTSPSDARNIVEAILESLAAAGIVITFVILAPKYRYLIDNPYLPTTEP
jgi:hypothetical protein